MKTATLKKLSILLAVLVGLVAITQGVSRWRLRPQSAYNERLKSLKPEAISTISLEKKANDQEPKIILHKENKDWKANGKKVTSAKVDELLSDLLTKDSVETIAQTNARHKELELTGDVATQVTLDQKVTVFIGKITPGGRYVRFADSDPVYVVKDLSYSSASVDPQDWYDKTIVAVDEKSLKKLEFKKSDEQFTLAKEETKWKLEKDQKEIKESVLSPLTQALSSLTASKVASDEEIKTYPTTPELTLIISADRETDTLIFYKNNDDYLVQRGRDQEHFLLISSQADKFFLSSKDLF